MLKTLYLVSTAPPTSCGLATFSNHVKKSLETVWNQNQMQVSRIIVHDESDQELFADSDELKIRKNVAHDYIQVAQTINSDPDCIGVLLQHEFGIFGGRNGEMVASLVETLSKPLFTTLHTVLETPQSNQIKIVQDLASRSEKIIVMIDSAKQILQDVYQISPRQIEVVPHGIPFVEFETPYEIRSLLKLPKEAKIMCTFGLLGPGKGLEYGIKALAEALKQIKDLHYFIIGRTHPNESRQNGENYRRHLQELANELEVSEQVHFVDKFLPESELLQWLQSADLYICPPQNPEQASSGTLSYALGSGRAVVATEFLHAKDVINDDIGWLIPFEDHNHLATILIKAFAEPHSLYRKGKNAYYQTREWLWDNTALKLGEIIGLDSVLSHPYRLPDPSIEPLFKRSDEFGLWQFGTLHQPDVVNGYTLDDNARALILITKLLQNETDIQTLTLDSMQQTYLKLVIRSYTSPNHVHNYFNLHHEPDHEQNSIEELSDARARGIWALGTYLGSTKTDHNELKEKAINLWQEIINSSSFNTAELSPRACSFVGLGILQRLKLPDLIKSEKHCLHIALQNRLTYISDLLTNTSDESWYWYEDILAYANGMLPEFHLYASAYFKNNPETSRALQTLEFLYQQSILVSNNETTIIPIGQNGWFKKGHEKALFDQQPEEPAHLVLACAAAAKINKDSIWQDRAYDVLSWFYGNNVHNMHVYNRQTNSTYDGLHESSVNLNSGAESLIMHELALLAYKNLEA